MKKTSWHLLLIVCIVSLGLIFIFANCKRKTMTDPLSGVAATGARSSGDACTGGGKTQSVTLVVGTTEKIYSAEGIQAQVVITAMAYNTCGQLMPDGTMVNWGASVGMVAPAASATTAGATTTTLTFPLNYSDCSTVTATSGEASVTISACTTPMTPTPGPSPTPTNTPEPGATATPTPTPTPDPCLVTNENDDGAGSLRQVLEDARSNACALITFAAGVSTIRLTSGSLGVTHPLTIDGGAAGVTISGGYQFTVFQVAGNGVDVTFQNLIITQGNSGGDGGGIIVKWGGFATIDTGTTISNCTAVNGGGIYNNGGRLTINGTLQDNLAATNGGGIYTNGGTLTVNGEISDNRSENDGGGIYSESGTVEISGTVSYNTAIKEGGGIKTNNSMITVTDTGAISYNTAYTGGGIKNTDRSSIVYIYGTVSHNHAITTSIWSGGSGGIGGGTLYIFGSVSDNESTGFAGGIGGGAAVIIEPSGVVSGNFSAEEGGGIYKGDITVKGRVINNRANADGGGIRVPNGFTLTLEPGHLIENNRARHGGGIYNDGTINGTCACYGNGNSPDNCDGSGCPIRCSTPCP